MEKLASDVLKFCSAMYDRVTAYISEATVCVTYLQFIKDGFWGWFKINLTLFKSLISHKWENIMNLFI